MPRPSSKEANYKGVNMEALKNQKIGGRAEGEWLKIDVSDVPIPVRILPPVGNMNELPWVEHVAHYCRVGGKYGGFDVDGQKRAITCLRVHGREGICPVCDVVDYYREQSKESPGEKKGTIASGLAPTTKYYMNVIDRRDGKTKRFGAGVKLVRKLKAIMLSKKGDITDLKTGRDIEIIRTGTVKQFETIEYNAICDDDRTPTGPHEPGIDCTSLIKILSIDEIMKALYASLPKDTGIDLDAAFEVEEEEKPARKTTKKAAKKARR